METKSSSLALLNPVEFAEVLNRRINTIVEAFLEIARTSVPAAANETERMLEDHLPEVLEASAKFIRSNGSQAEKDALCALASRHGITRASVESYTTGQIRQEYSILRRQIFLCLKPSEELSKESARLYAETCELSLAITIETFLKARNKGL